MTKLTSFCLGGCLCIRLLTLKMLRCSESQQLFSSFRSAPTQHSSLSPFASQIISHRMTLNTAKALLHPPCYPLCVFSVVWSFYFLCDRSRTKFLNRWKAKRAETEKFTSPFSRFLLNFLSAMQSGRGCPGWSANPLPPPPKHTHVRARTNTLLNVRNKPYTLQYVLPRFIVS